ncbi:hypothetical protein K1719_029133 [Acacia pycnantha]|nr:hypothetical protein K1719_046329 [Acacia pycnantha]KAI9089528.1 hypothetical protein K1719_029133 [Acacia pycnantha]
MSDRTLVPIFVFWAFLTIITPTLVLLSENSKQDFDLYGNYSAEVAGDRRTMGDREYGIRKTTPPLCTTVVETEEVSPAAPAEAPIIVSLPAGANLTAAGAACGHNGSVGSNKSDDGVTQVVFSRKHLKQNKTPIHALAS